VLRSVRVRITLWYVLLLAVVLAAFCAGVYLVLRDSLYSNLDDSIQNRAATFQGLVEFEAGRPTLPESAASTGVDADERYVRVFDADGEVTFDGSVAAGGAPINEEAIERALRGDSSAWSTRIGDESLRARGFTIEQDREVVGMLEVGVTEDDVEETLQTLLLIMLVGYPITLAIATAGGLFLAGRVLSPIDDVTRMARRISAEDLSQRLELDLPDDEVGRLARTFDEMIARLDEAFRRQRQFTADASHELRTPLTVIKGQVDVALRQPRDEAGYREVLRSVNEEVDRLNRMVGSLLTLARADAGQSIIAADMVNLGELVGGAVEQVRPLAEQKGLRIGVEAAAEVTLAADEDLLLQLLLNLLDNAIKFTPSGGSVTAGWREEGDWSELWVSDTGVGIAEHELGRVFDRFYRADSARSGGGAGLGLSICRWIAEAHGGSIMAESVVGGGATIRVRLPVERRTRD
jgi:heavy metal sensor kinase